MGKAQKINVTLPSFLISRIAHKLKESNEFKSRSQFLAIAADRLLQSR
ncbi:type II toxin-antitoxin system HicB family antitoxin [Terasakiispira papahanaumokuakeensis]